MNKHLILCAGHGGGDSGAVGQGTTEAATCINIVNVTAELIRQDGRFGVTVVPPELGLVDSINWVNNRFANLEDGYALEVHKNAAVGAHGVETWYYGGDAQSQAYAQAIQDGLATTGLPNRGVKPDTSNRHGSLGWVRQTNPWAGLAECGFITDGGDPIDPSLYARGIYQGALRLFGLAPKPAPAPAPAPTPVAIAYRVYDNTKQIGAYASEQNAWNKYSTAGGVRILDSKGNDVTATLVAKYRPVTTDGCSVALEAVKRENSALKELLKKIKGLLQ